MRSQNDCFESGAPYDMCVAASAYTSSDHWAIPTTYDPRQGVYVTGSLPTGQAGQPLSQGIAPLSSSGVAATDAEIAQAEGAQSLLLIGAGLLLLLLLLKR